MSYTYDRAGRQATIADATGTRNFAYSATTLDLESETLPSAFYGDVVLTRQYDASGRTAGYELGTAADPDVTQAVGYAYDAYGRFGQVTSSDLAAPSAVTYGYAENSDMVTTTTFPNGPVTTRSYEAQRNLIDYVENRVAATTISKYDYTNDAVGRRTAVEKTGTAFAQADTISYGYNDRSEVTGGVAVNDAAYDYGYGYDPIGNRLQSNAGQQTCSYTSNQVNQYTAVSCLTPSPAYDDDGNMTTMPSATSTWSLTWDGENRLISAESATARLEFQYDFMSRRVQKKTHSAVLTASS